MVATATNMEVPVGSVVYDINTQANEIVKEYVIYSMGTGFVPLPIIDLIGLVGLQIKMVHSLSKLYDIPFSEERVKGILYSLLGGVLSIAGAGLLASAVKVIPIIGQVAGSASMASLGGASTYAIGRIFVKHFEEGGNLENLDVNSAKEDLKSNINTAKTTAKNIQKES